MRFNCRGSGLLAMLVLACSVRAAAPQQEPAQAGEGVYQRTCAMCHDHAEALRAPTLATLKGMRYQQIYFALTVGKMQAQGQAPVRTLSSSRAHRFSDRPGPGERCTWTAQMRCTPAAAGKDRPEHARDGGRFRLRPAQPSPPSRPRRRGSRRPRLPPHGARLGALAFPARHDHARPGSGGGHDLVSPRRRRRASCTPSTSAHRSRCIKWIYKSDVPLRTGVGYGALPGSHRKVLVFADVGTRIHMVDAATGAPIWKHAVHLTVAFRTPPVRRCCSADRVYVPLSASRRSMSGRMPKHLCCTTHGAVHCTRCAQPGAGHLDRAHHGGCQADP